MKIRITSKGSPENTHVVNAETGEPLEQVTSVTWSVSLDGIATATVTLRGVSIDAVAHADVLDDLTSDIVPDAVTEAGGDE